MNQTPVSENKMGVMPVGRLLMNMATPMIIAMMVQALYNVVDSVYVSRVSESAVTALSLAFPVQMLQVGFSVGIGVGVNSLLSKSLGEKNQEMVNRAAGNGILLALGAIVLFMLFGIFGSRPYFQMQSKVAETVEGGTAYTAICCTFTFGIFVEVLGERLLQSTGRTFHTLISQGTGALLNILLDPVFIFGVDWLGIPAMGIAGAAVATVIGQWVGAVLVIIFNLRCNPEIQFGLRYLKPEGAAIRQILAVGLPTTIMNSIGSVMNFGMNQILQGFHETATGVFGIYYKLQSFFFMPIFGINNATISMIAYNYGARKPKRITKTLKLSAAMAMAIMILGVAAFQLVPDQLLDLFHPSEDFLTIGRSALRIISIHFPLAAIGISLSACFQALGNGVYATVVSICRQLVVLLPAAYLLSLTGNVNAVWWAFPIAELISVLVTLFFFARIYRKKIHPLFQA